MKTRFFTKTDWSAFWTATTISFLVYFFTAAPSVTLEDAGELVTAGDHLGVPHPPGYPIWSVFAFLFARMLGFVKFLGQPTPAWAISVMSGFFGAVAAGLTAMLITRTASDMLADFDATGAPAADRPRHALVSWVGGVAGSLVFAFSPVEWSQATIPEVYTLNALFLMWVFLLSYRWMRRPSDKVLWATAFVFGLGLTNYQVLMFAIVPLAVIIFLRDVALFRDFVLAVIPFLLTAGILMLGAQASRPGFVKHAPYHGFEEFLGPALVHPGFYVAAVICLAVIIGACIAAGLAARKGELSDSQKYTYGGVAACAGLALFLVCVAVPGAPVPADFAHAPADSVFSWGKPAFVFLSGLAALWVFAWATPGGRWYASAVTAVEISLAIFLRKGALLGLTHPLTGYFLFYVALNFAVLALVAALLPRGRAIAVAFLCAEAGAAFYGYMPISSDTNPPMNWGYPRTWEGFKHAISRGQYEKIVPTNPFAPVVVEQMGSYFSDLRMQFTFLLAPLGFLPFTLWRVRGPKRKTVFDGFFAGFVLAAAIAVFAAVDRLWNKDMAFVPPVIFQIAFAVLIVAAGAGFVLVLIRQARKIYDVVVSPDHPLSERITSGLTLAGLVLGLLVFACGMCFASATYAVVGSASLPDEFALHQTGIYIRTGLLVLLLLAVVVGLAALSWKKDAPLAMKVDDTAQQWFLSTFLCFLVMSFLLIVLAAPKGDVQDNFIQKVKFISSHAIFSLWVGYALVCGLALVAAIERKLRASADAASAALTKSGAPRFTPLLLLAALLVLVGAPLIPVYENYCNDDLVEVMSAAEQNGHDFGWQFGNYQLRGANGIAEELSPDEEPLPNPDYPPEMTTNAVFYGGTDPGRFVPTYMIYSADVRPDVFLITQNALADNTYMNTMRDLYGDQIWMPTQKDNGDAFQKYVDGVKNGTMPNYGDISFEDGRVQVSGALAVMEINGILTERIFQKNRDRHDFYLEESYALRWMYPYLTPHGLIMKIEHDQTPVTSDRVDNDMDFWDWYSRRLLARPEYKRDLVARKSFSKLRGAIAGLYANHGRMRDAERAFRESVRLYPASPEANLRIVQEILMPYRRFGEALRLLTALQKADPNNKRLPGIVAQVQAAEDRRVNIEKLSKKGSETGLTVDESLVLARDLHAMGMADRAAGAVKQILDNPEGLSPVQLVHLGDLAVQLQKSAEAAKIFARVPAAQLAQIATPEEQMAAVSAFLSAGRMSDAHNVLVRYLKQNDGDYRGWLDLCQILRRMGQPQKAAVAMQKAFRVDAKGTEQIVANTPDLLEFFKQAFQPRTPAP